jgi:transposase
VGVRSELGTPAQHVPPVIVTLAPALELPTRCSRCDTEAVTVYEVRQRHVRDLPLLDTETWVEFPRAQVESPRCGPTGEAVRWLDDYRRMTTRLVRAIARVE